MGIGASIFLFAIGAILRFAVDVTTEGFDIHMVGVILMVVGIVGALFSMMFWSSWGGWNNAGVGRDEVIVERDRPRTVIERERRV